jgi:Rap1a immunity proteins
MKGIRDMRLLIGMVILMTLFAGNNIALASEKTDVTQGAFLYHACEAANRSHPAPSDVELGTICLVYIEGFTDGENSAGKGDCASSSYPEMARVYVAWMKNHPEAMKMPKAVGLSIALRSAYPCHNK